MGVRRMCTATCSYVVIVEIIKSTKSNLNINSTWQCYNFFCWATLAELLFIRCRICLKSSSSSLLSDVIESITDCIGCSIYGRSSMLNVATDPTLWYIPNNTCIISIWACACVCVCICTRNSQTKLAVLLGSVDIRMQQQLCFEDP